MIVAAQSVKLSEHGQVVHMLMLLAVLFIIINHFAL